MLPIFLLQNMEGKQRALGFQGAACLWVRVKHVRLPKYPHQPTVLYLTLMRYTGASAQRLPVRRDNFILIRPFAICQLQFIKFWSLFFLVFCLFSCLPSTICIKYCYPWLFFPFLSVFRLLFPFLKKRFKKKQHLTPPHAPSLPWPSSVWAQHQRLPLRLPV